MNPTLRRVVLFLGLVIPGFVVLAVLARERPVPRSSRAVVEVVDPTARPTVSVESEGGRALVGRARTVRGHHVATLELEAKDGTTRSRRFIPWILEFATARPGPRGLRVDVDELKLDVAREPETLEEYEARLRKTEPPAAVLTSKNAVIRRLDESWARVLSVLLSGEVDLTARDPEGRAGTLRTESLLYRMAGHHLSSDETVSVERAGFRLEGRGLDARLDLRRIELRDDVALDLDLAQAELPFDELPAEMAESDAPFRLTCSGPLLLEDLPAKGPDPRRIRIQARENVRGTRGETEQVDCDSLEMMLEVVVDPETGEERPQLVSMDLDRLRPLILHTKDGDPVRVEGERLRWRRRGDSAWEAVVTGSPRIVVAVRNADLDPGALATDDSRVDLDIRCRGNAILLVSREAGLEQFVLEKDVVVAREEETLTADEVTVRREVGGRRLTARGDVTVDGERLRATAAEIRSIEKHGGDGDEDDERRLVLSGTPVVVLRGTPPGLFGGSDAKDEKEKDTARSGETEVRTVGPLVLVETAAGTTVKTEEGVTVIRRDATREQGTLKAETLAINLTPERAVIDMNATGGVNVDGRLDRDATLRADSEHLIYVAEQESLTLRGSGSAVARLNLADPSGTTVLEGRVVRWSEATGDFSVSGSVDMTTPATVDLLEALRPPGAEADAKAGTIRLRCESLTGRLLLDEGTGRRALHSAFAEERVVLEGPRALARGDRLRIARHEDAYRAAIEGTPAHLEDRLDPARVNVFEGPALSIVGTEDRELQRLDAPKGGRGVLHLAPRKAGDAPTRIDFESPGRILLDDRTLTAPAGVSIEHRAFDMKKSAWQAPILISGKKLEARFGFAEKSAERVVEFIEIVEDVVVDSPGDRRLTCAKARIRPRQETIELFGSPRVKMVFEDGTARSCSKAFYSYRTDIEDGTRWRVTNLR